MGITWGPPITWHVGDSVDIDFEGELRRGKIIAFEGDSYRGQRPIAVVQLGNGTVVRVGIALLTRTP